MNTINCTAATLRAILYYINSGKTPDIAYDRDDLAQPLIEKIKSAVGDSGGSKSSSIIFNEDEKEIQRQFSLVCKNIKDIFSQVEYFSK